MSDVDDYIRAHRDRFTREALTEQLLGAGHERDAIEAAWRRVDAQDGAVAQPVAVGTGTRITSIVLILVVIAAYAYVGFIGVIGLSFAATGFHGGSVGTIFSLAMLVYGIAMLAGLAFAIRRIWRAPSRGGGASAITVAVGVALLVLIGVNGGCIAGAFVAQGLRSIAP